MEDQEYIVKMAEYQVISSQVNLLQGTVQQAAMGLKQQPHNLELLKLYNDAENDLKLFTEPFNNIKNIIAAEIESRYLKPNEKLKYITQHLQLMPNVPRPSSVISSVEG